MKSVFMLPDGGLGNKLETMAAYIPLSKLIHLDIQLPPNGKHKSIFEIIAWDERNRVLDAQTDFSSKCILDLGERDRTVNEVKGVRKGYFRNLKKVDREEVQKIDYHFPWQEVRPLNDNPKYDVVIANGASTAKDLWEAKRYSLWQVVAEELVDKGLHVASVGFESEYVFGTDNKTDLSLKETVDLIVEARCFAGNDTGLYHAAGLFEVPGVVVFTCTNPTKNYNPCFHRSISPVVPDLPCFPCQGTEDSLWSFSEAFFDCRGRACRAISPEVVVNRILSVLES